MDVRVLGRLRELGWIDGSNVAIQYRWAEGRSERFAQIAAEFVQSDVSVIVTAGAAVLAAKQATSRFQSSLRSHQTHSAAASLRFWLDPAGMSPVCRSRLPTLLVKDWKFCESCSWSTHSGGHGQC